MPGCRMGAAGEKLVAAEAEAARLEALRELLQQADVLARQPRARASADAGGRGVQCDAEKGQRAGAPAGEPHSWEKGVGFGAHMPPAVLLLGCLVPVDPLSLAAVREVVEQAAPSLLRPPAAGDASAAESPLSVLSRLEVTACGQRAGADARAASRQAALDADAARVRAAEQVSDGQGGGGGLCRFAAVQLSRPCAAPTLTAPALRPGVGSAREGALRV